MHKILIQTPRLKVLSPNELRIALESFFWIATCRVEVNSNLELTVTLHSILQCEHKSKPALLCTLKTDIPFLVMYHVH